MACPLCQHRKARRDCPALGQEICAVCCGTKRLVEINCPESCAHLATARANPPAAVRKQQDLDAALLMPSIQRLTERQYQLFFLFQSVIARHRPDVLAPLVDDDVAAAAGAVAATLETAARGVIYEHAPPSVVAQKLAGELTAMLAHLRQQGATVYDGEAAITLRAVEQGAKTVQTLTGGAPDAYLTMMARLLQVNRAAPARDRTAGAGEGPNQGPNQGPASSIILP